MSVVQTVKSVLGMENDANRMRCESCDHTFETHMDADSVWLACPECDSDDVSLASGT